MTKTLRAFALSLVLSVVVPFLWSFTGYDGPERWQGNPTLTVTNELGLENPFFVADLARVAWEQDSAGFTTGVKLVSGMPELTKADFISGDYKTMIPAHRGNIHVKRGTLPKNSSGERVVAEAQMTYAPGTHYITACTIVLTPAAFDKQGDPRTEIMTHEMGHCLGLHHEVHQAGTNMYRAAGWYQQGWKDFPTDWDQKNLRDLYSD